MGSKETHPRLLILASDYLPAHSGVGHYVQQLARELSRPDVPNSDRPARPTSHDSWDVSVAAPGAQFQGRVIPSSRLATHGPSSFSIERLLEWTALMSGLGAAGQRPDLIHAHGFMSAIAAQTLSDMFSIPWILTKHCWIEEYDHAPSEVFRLQRWAVDHATAIISTSHWLTQRMVDHCNPRSTPHVIYADAEVNDHLLNSGAKRRDGGVNGTTVGRMFVHNGVQYRKGADRTLALFARFASPDDRLIMIGRCESTMRETVDAYRSDPRITFTDQISHEEVWDYYAHASAVLAPSRSEGLPLAVIEAQKIGCPVITTHDTSTDEIVEHGITGYCARDDEELGQLIACFSAQSLPAPETIAQRTRNTFSWKKTAAAHRALYSQLL